VSTARKLSVIVRILLSCSLPAALASTATAEAAPAKAADHCPAAAARRSRRAARACRARHHAPKPVKTRLAKPPREHAAKTKAKPERAEPAQTNEPAPPPPTATAHASAIGAMLATPCANTEITPEASNLELVRAAILCLINVKRAENGENPLKTNAELEAAAEGHCRELIADDYFAHVSPSGETPVDRIRELGYIPGPNVGYVIGENLAWGTYQLSTPQSIASAWFASPGHLANILEAQYTETGIGVTAAVPSSLGDGAPGATYAQEFGVIIR
jgi:uncharacterized protein YkwD